MVVAAIYALFGEATILAFFRGVFQDAALSGSALNLNWLATAAIEFGTGELQNNGGKVHTLHVGGHPIFERVSNALRIVTFFGSSCPILLVRAEIRRSAAVIDRRFSLLFQFRFRRA